MVAARPGLPAYRPAHAPPGTDQDGRTGAAPGTGPDRDPAGSRNVTGPDRPPASAPGARRWWLLLIAGLICLVCLELYLDEIAARPVRQMLTWFDLRVYADAGRLALRQPADLYRWHLRHGIRFTYTPFAAVLFAGAAQLSWLVLSRGMTIISLLALPATGWLTFGALGWRSARRAAATLLLTGVGLWTQPVQRALHLGQIEIVLMLLIVADRCLRDQNWAKGVGIGLAAGIKLIPLIFVPYLLLAGRRREAAVATGTFAGTVLVGFALLPKQSADFWLTGYFLRVHNVTGSGALVNQSLFGVLTRAEHGVIAAAQPTWLVSAALVGAAGLAAAAVLDRSGWPVHGWLVCALTGLLVSPISWDHHWVWIVPGLAALTDLALHARGRIRWAWAGLAAVLAVAFLGWPALAGPRSLLPEGLLGFFPGRLVGSATFQLSRAAAFHLHGLALIGWNLYVIAGLVTLGAAIAAAVRCWRGGQSPISGLGLRLTNPRQFQGAPGDATARL